MKKVLFDLMACQPANGSKFHGGGEYIKIVFKEIVEIYGAEVNISVFYNPKEFLDEWIYELIEINRIRTFHVKDYIEVSALIKSETFDTFFAGLMNGVDKIQFTKDIKVIGVYHGFRSLEKPIDTTSYLYKNGLKNKFKEVGKQIFVKKYYQRKYDEQAKKLNSCTDIVGVSGHSGYAARVFFPKFNENNIHVFYSPEKYVSSFGIKNELSSEKYILMLGGDRWVKNIYRGLIAIDQLFSDSFLNDYHVKVVGGIPKSIYKKLINVDRMITLEYLSTEELENLYCNCDFFFYPTLNEGFGYPPQEVMKYGKTCVISAINSLIEVYGDCVYYCNPYDINEMKCRLIQAAENKIDQSKIETNMERIRFKQHNDMRSLCRLIVD